MAVAIYDYQSLGDGEEDSLEFEEGELIEVMSRYIGSPSLPMLMYIYVVECTGGFV